MNNELREQISAFVDNELSEAEASLLIRRLAADTTLRDEAARMIRLSQRIRSEYSAADHGFAARVLAAIHDEPTLTTAPGDSAAAEASRPQGWLRLVAGGGIAAVVAVLAINALPERSDTTVPARSVAALTESSEAVVSEPVEYVTPSVLTDSGLVSADPELAAYFLSHTASGPSLAPGSGRVRMLGGDALGEPESEAAPE